MYGWIRGGSIAINCGSTLTWLAGLRLFIQTVGHLCSKIRLTLCWRHYTQPWRHVGTRWSRVVSFTPLPLYLLERAGGIHWIGGWVRPRDGLDFVIRRKYCPVGNWTRTFHAVAHLYTGLVIQTPGLWGKSNNSIMVLCFSAPSGFLGGCWRFGRTLLSSS
jgi:hypothetical protein